MARDYDGKPVLDFRERLRAGYNLIGYPGGEGKIEQTTFDYALSGVTPPPAGSFIHARTDLVNLEQLPLALLPAPNSTTVSQSVSIPTILDWSMVDTLYLLQSLYSTQGNFQGFVLGPTAIETGVSLVDGSTNSITATLQPSTTATLALSIKGSEWAAAMQGIGPASAKPYYTDYALVAQPYLANGYVSEALNIPTVGAFSLLPPSSQAVGVISALPCTTLQFPPLPVGIALGLSPIVSDVDYGTLNYGDPFPADWQRLFQYCQASQVSVQQPNSTTNTFTVVNRQITPPPTGPVGPLVTPRAEPDARWKQFLF